MISIRPVTILSARSLCAPRIHLLAATLFLAVNGVGISLAAPVSVDYLDANGLSAKADFDLLDGGGTLQIILKNTTAAPYGGAGVDGDGNMVLSSINFDLGDVDILDGTVALAGSSSVVKKSGASWDPQATPNLNEQYGFSNSGIGNTPSLFANALHSVTAHSNGGTNVTNFEGTGNRTGLDYGLVAPGSSAFGTNEFILDCVEIRLALSSPLSDLSFLANGSYVEFGSDFLYTPVPEPGTWAMAALAITAIVARRWRRRSIRVSG
jgi:hypothetical protein